MITNIQFDGIDYNDYPDFADAEIIYAEQDGVPMTDDELEDLNEDRDLVYELLMDYIC